MLKLLACIYERVREESGIDKHKENWINPRLKRRFAGSEAQTPFEATKRFWAYDSDDSDGGWDGNLIKVKHERTRLETKKKRKRNQSKVAYAKLRMEEKMWNKEFYISSLPSVAQTLPKCHQLNLHNTDFL